MLSNWNSWNLVDVKFEIVKTPVQCIYNDLVILV